MPFDNSQRFIIDAALIAKTNGSLTLDPQRVETEMDKVGAVRDFLAVAAGGSVQLQSADQGWKGNALQHESDADRAESKEDNQVTLGKRIIVRQRSRKRESGGKGHNTSHTRPSDDEDLAEGRLLLCVEKPGPHQPRKTSNGTRIDFGLSVAAAREVSPSSRRQAKVHLSAASKLLTAEVDLHNRRILRRTADMGSPCQ
jgi:hypothetical protein